ncbi:hypothetical protein LLS1_24360 [Leifsonia sp. LS1]|uniref:polyprenol monophosphomannose synthase n=1 Tax=Leifsonia sp. LS1 TaxID=2828483 RepID=UPI001CFDEF03|nr:polyprenol monophosphomannose synthase [Leifsonia sp. LS1]GIT80767.1 hypothetical protein LLS1_24360 [Leifsonia sp. LS1]
MSHPRCDVTLVVPTFNEAGNIVRLLDKIEEAVDAATTEVLFVDDSSDDTPDRILDQSEIRDLPVRLLHRDDAVGGLAGAVVAGMRDARGHWVVVLDADLQHDPATIPAVLRQAQTSGADVVVASRNIPGGSSSGLETRVRRLVSHVSTTVAKMLFPRRLRQCSDPMSGFFAVRRSAVDLDALAPTGFKILLEILVRTSPRVAEVPLAFGERHDGESKAGLANGLAFAHQLVTLRTHRQARPVAGVRR